MMNAESFINNLIEDHQKSEVEHERISAEIAVRRKEIRESIAEKKERFRNRRGVRQKSFDFIR
ncbi:hypothetical protein [Bacillus badius]|uniref:Uncharacterized protein n=1 Tax=Bacillus badius TaxID=1455 RepID=A0ABR5AXW2_BACBA|nr:hypothetical protein [Bacillus badius]KIL79581.1 hypothetical protein SD77_2035 [Bacillus badius]MED4716277.1 hypothetical protein [Bacillus badius]